MKIETFLIIDHHEDYLNDLKNLLNYMNYYQIDLATDTSDAMEKIQTNDYDCLMAAYDLPMLHDSNFFSLLKEKEKSPPFFLTHTGFSKLDIIRYGLLGASGFLKKPYDIENIVNKIEAISMGNQTERVLLKHYQKGLIIIKDGKYNQAIPYFKGFIKLIPEPEYYYNQGVIEAIRKNSDNALLAFKRASFIVNLSVKSYKAIGKSYRETGNETESKKFYKKAASYQKNQSLKYDEALISEVLDINSKTENIYNSLGVILRRRGELKAALAQYFTAIRLHPEESHIYYNIGRLYIEIGKEKKAHHFFLKAVELNPDFEDGKTALDAVRKGEARAYFKNFITHS